MSGAHPSSQPCCRTSFAVRSAPASAPLLPPASSAVRSTPTRAQEPRLRRRWARGSCRKHAPPPLHAPTSVHRHRQRGTVGDAPPLHELVPVWGRETVELGHGGSHAPFQDGAAAELACGGSRTFVRGGVAADHALDGSRAPVQGQVAAELARPGRSTPAAAPSHPSGVERRQSSRPPLLGPSSAVAPPEMRVSAPWAMPEPLRPQSSLFHLQSRRRHRRNIAAPAVPPACARRGPPLRKTAPRLRARLRARLRCAAGWTRAGGEAVPPLCRPWLCRPCGAHMSGAQSA